MLAGSTTTAVLVVAELVAVELAATTVACFDEATPPPALPTGSFAKKSSISAFGSVETWLSVPQKAFAHGH